MRLRGVDLALISLLGLLTTSTSLVADSEQIGMSTLTQMTRQREQMQFASDNLNGTVNAMAQARQILKKM